MCGDRGNVLHQCLLPDLTWFRSVMEYIPWTMKSYFCIISPNTNSTETDGVTLWSQTSGILRSEHNEANRQTDSVTSHFRSGTAAGEMVELVRFNVYNIISGLLLEQKELKWLLDGFLYKRFKHQILHLLDALNCKSNCFVLQNLHLKKCDGSFIWKQ